MRVHVRGRAWLHVVPCILADVLSTARAAPVTRCRETGTATPSLVFAEATRTSGSTECPHSDAMGHKAPRPQRRTDRRQPPRMRQTHRRRQPRRLGSKARRARASCSGRAVLRARRHRMGALTQNGAADAFGANCYYTHTSSRSTEHGARTQSRSLTCKFSFSASSASSSSVRSPSAFRLSSPDAQLM